MRFVKLTAHDLIDTHGRYAAGEAFMRAIHSAARYDEDGEDYWLTVVGAVMDIPTVMPHTNSDPRIGSYNSPCAAIVEARRLLNRTSAATEEAVLNAIEREIAREPSARRFWRLVQKEALDLLIAADKRREIRIHS
jgi:hypothetical protein